MDVKFVVYRVFIEPWYYITSIGSGFIPSRIFAFFETFDPYGPFDYGFEVLALVYCGDAYAASAGKTFLSFFGCETYYSIVFTFRLQRMVFRATRMPRDFQRKDGFAFRSIKRADFGIGVSIYKCRYSSVIWPILLRYRRFFCEVGLCICDSIQATYPIFAVLDRYGPRPIGATYVGEDWMRFAIKDFFWFFAGFYVVVPYLCEFMVWSVEFGGVYIPMRGDYACVREGAGSYSIDFKVGVGS